jgi:hypothetical protein
MYLAAQCFEAGGGDGPPEEGLHAMRALDRSTCPEVLFAKNLTNKLRGPGLGTPVITHITSQIIDIMQDSVHMYSIYIFCRVGSLCGGQ